MGKVAAAAIFLKIGTWKELVSSLPNSKIREITELN